MRTLLGLAILGTGFIVISSHNFNLGPGLSIKNLFIYLPGLFLFLNPLLLGRVMRLENRAIHAWFGILIVYALVSTLIAALVVKYPNYELLTNIMDLKGGIFDWWLIFLVFSQGPRTEEDIESLLKLLLIVVGIANLLTIGQLIGAFNMGREIICDDFGDSSRVCGVFGHANETAALIALFVPAFIAVVESATGFRKLMWIGLLTPCLTMMILTASRGAIVGLVAGGAWAAIPCRKYLSAQRFVKWLSVSAALLVPMLLVVGVKYWDKMASRWTEGSTVSAASMTSGRTEIWQGYLTKMIEYPWTFITGFGWNAHSVMNFPVVPHNQYLTMWFTIGLVGVVGLVAIFRNIVLSTLAAAQAAPAGSRARRQMVAAVFGTLILAVSIFFGTMFIPWTFIWIYFGLVVRYSVVIRAAAYSPVAAESRQRPAPRRAMPLPVGGTSRSST